MKRKNSKLKYAVIIWLSLWIIIGLVVSISHGIQQSDTAIWNSKNLGTISMTQAVFETTLGTIAEYLARGLFYGAIVLIIYWLIGKKK